MIGIGIGVPFSFSSPIDANAQTIYNRIIADGGVSNLTRLNFFVKGLKAIYGDLANVPVCYDAHWIGYKLGSGTGATSGQAAAKLYSLTVAGDAVQSTAASQPLLLSHNGASTDNYWYSPNVTNNCVSTPNASVNQITGDFDIIAYVKHTTNLTLNALVSKNDSGSNRGYSFVFDNNNLVLYYGLTTLNVASSTATIASGSILWVRCTRVSSTGIITFFTSNDASTTNPQSVTWTQLGTTISGITGALNSSGTLPLLIGGYISANSGFGSNENIYRLTISNSIGGAPVVDFNPAQYNAATSQTAWTSSTGEVWTINTGTATSGYKGVLVDRTIVMGDGVDDSMQTTTQYLPIDKSFYAADKYFSSNLTASSGGIRVLNGNFGQNNSTSRRMWFNAGNNEIVASTANIATLNLNTGSVASGDTKFRVNTGADTTSTVVFVSIISREVNIFNTFTICNAQLNTLVITNQVDTNLQKTATYNLIRSLNNNAF
jgi:hypothetical protein